VARAFSRAELDTSLVILVRLRMPLQFVLCGFLISCFCPPLWCQSTAPQLDINPSRVDVGQGVRRFEARYRSASRLEVTFLERYSESGRVVRAEAGKAYFARPGKMRWEYEAPEKNVFLVDGKTAWFYVPADHTVTRVPAKKSTDWRTPLALLAGEVKLSRICNRIGDAPQRAPENSADVVLYCELRGASKSDEGRDADGPPAPVGLPDVAYLEVVENSGELVRVLVNDSGGVGIEFRFANWQFNPKVDDSFFRFQVPRGVAIVNGELGAAQKSASP
jgi:outer membrane lipoprotein carrier protein